MPVNDAAGVERVLLRLALKRFPINVLRIAIGRYRTFPITIRSIPVVMSMNLRDYTHFLRSKVLAGRLNRRPTGALDADLHDASRTFPYLAHTLGVVWSECHRL